MESKNLKLILIISGAFMAGLVLAVAILIPTTKKVPKEEEKFPTRIEEVKVWPPTLSDATEDEKARVRGKTEQEIESEFYKEKQECLERFKITKPEDLLAADVNQAISFITCQAVRDDKLNQCDLLKTNQSAYQQCQEISNWYLKVLFPALRGNDCSPEIIKECQVIGAKNCQAFCQGLILDKVEACDKLKDSPLEKTMCLAVAKKDLSFCQQLENQDDKTNCQDVYHFISSVKENQPSYLDNIKNGINFALGKLFFNRSLSCEDLLTPFNEEYCSPTYSLEILGRRLDISRQLKYIED